MNKNTVIRIAIPLSLYESVKGKVLNEEFINPRQKAFGILQTMQELGVSDESILQYVLGNYMNGSDAEDAMNSAYKEFVGDFEDEEEDLEEADKKSEQDKLNDPEYLKKLQAAVEKARKGDSTDLAILMNVPQGMNEAKKTVDPAKKKTDVKAEKKKIEDKKAVEKKKAEAEKKK